MEGHGFDWLNVPTQGSRISSIDNSRSTSPAPNVSFTNMGNSDSTLASNVLPTSLDNTLRYNNPLADDILQSHTNRFQQESTVDSNELSIPLSLTTQELTLPESRTYIRWYSDILARTNARTISMSDVFTFLNNFKLDQKLKDDLTKLYSKTVMSINIGEFFALLRIISHCLNGHPFSRKLIKMSGPIPTPPSILRKKRLSDEGEDDLEDNIEEQNGSQPVKANKPLDLDSFTQFMLTGERPDDKPNKRKKKMKSVKFSDQIVTGVQEANENSISPVPSPSNELDLSLPMDQLLNRINGLNTGDNQQSGDAEEQQVLQDMGSQLNHFQNLNSVDTASIGGVPASIHLNASNNVSSEQLLKPNMTGPAQMSQYLQYQQQKGNEPEDDNDKYLPLKPNRTGPYDMVRMFSPNTQEQSQLQQQPNEFFTEAPQIPPKISLQSFTNQMTGNTADNTAANSRVVSSPPFERPLPAPPAPLSRRTRSLSSPTPPPPPASRLSPLTNGSRNAPPPPPPSRRRGVSASFSPSPNSTPQPSLPPKIPQYSNSLQAPDPQLFMPSQSQSTQQDQNNVSNNPYLTNNDSTANILDDLKQLQAEVDRIRDMTGGF